ncbi:hypothetical protein NEOC65_001185 [Neochlamydia sp. AcF65]|nr:hypothetical protein [Neochlamydia sp. AcF65]
MDGFFLLFSSLKNHLARYSIIGFIALDWFNYLKEHYRVILKKLKGLLTKNSFILKYGKKSPFYKA